MAFSATKIRFGISLGELRLGMEIENGNGENRKGEWEYLREE